MEGLTFTRTPNIRLRPFLPWHAAIVYTPDEPAHHWLNSTSWLILEMCDGADFGALVRRFAESVPEKSHEAHAIVESCLLNLQQKGLVTTNPSAKTMKEATAHA